MQVKKENSPHKRLTILISFPWLDLGGGPISSMAIAKELQSRGHKIIYISEIKDFEEVLRWSGIDYYYDIPMPVHLLVPELFSFSIVSVFRFIKIINSEKVDVVHSFHYADFLISSIAKFVTGVPTVVSFLGPGIPPWGTPKLKGRLVVCSGELRDKITAKYKLKSESITVIPNHINLVKFRPWIDTSEFTSRFQLTPETKKIVMVSRITRGKHQAIISLLKAIPEIVSEIPKIETIIVGDGDYFDEINEKANQVNKKVGKRVVILTGGLIDIPQILNIADVVIGIGRCALEGMACQKPTIIVGENGFAGIVASDTVGEIGYFNFAGRNVLEPISPSLLAKAIVKILSNERYAQELSTFSRRYVEDNFDVKKDAEKLEQIYLEEIIKNKPFKLKSRLQLVISIVEVFFSMIMMALYKIVKKVQKCHLSRTV